MASIKKRAHPDKIAHPSVGTVAELAERLSKLSSLSEFELRPHYLDSLLLSREDMELYGFVVEMPPGPGGDRPTEVGNTMKCDRCACDYVVTPTPSEECVHHWGRLYPTKINGTLAMCLAIS